MPGQVSHKGTKYTKKIYFVVSMALWVIRQFIINMALVPNTLQQSWSVEECAKNIYY
jgi:hypothetical protein